jgi:hypothetical protein
MIGGCYGLQVHSNTYNFVMFVGNFVMFTGGFCTASTAVAS